MGVSKSFYAYTNGHRSDSKKEKLDNFCMDTGIEVIDGVVRRETTKSKDVLQAIVDDAFFGSLLVHSWSDINDPVALKALRKKNFAIVIVNQFTPNDYIPVVPEEWSMISFEHPLVEHALKNNTRIDRSLSGNRNIEMKMNRQNARNIMESEEASEHAAFLVEHFFRISKEHKTVVQAEICKVANEEGLRTRKTKKAPEGNPITSNTFKRLLEQACRDVEWYVWVEEFKSNATQE